MRKKTLYLLFMPLLFFLFLFPKESFQASLQGVRLWSYTILPSLLPFLILSDLLLHSKPKILHQKQLNLVCYKLLGTSSYGAYVLLLGLFCGFPMGAKLTGDLYQSGYFTKEEATYLLMISNHASPTFIINILVLHTLQEETLLRPVLLILYGSVALSVLSVRIWYHTQNRPVFVFTKKEVAMTSSPGAILDTSIMNGFEIITRLGGYIILFSIYGALLRQILLPLPYLQTFLTGLTEITTGMICIRNSILPGRLQFFLILCCTSFGGLSTLAQTNCVIEKSGLSIRAYLSGKLINTTFTALLTILFFVI